MIILPITTDAPIYHWPRITVGLIATNVAIHLAWSYAPDPLAFEPYLLILGDGLHPMQWLSHNFLHADFLHLLGNMVFLWAYGIVVEGKVGWWPFLLIYLGIGIVHERRYCSVQSADHSDASRAPAFGQVAAAHAPAALRVCRATPRRVEAHY